MIRVGVVGFGNLGKAVGLGIEATRDMDLVAYFSRREISDNDKVISYDKIYDYRDQIDVLILCTSSDHDIESQGPELIKYFNTVDSFDNHNKIFDYYHTMDKLAKENNKLALISTGWDPGLFSIFRTYGQAIMPAADTYTFWGRGVSQGHSAAVRRIEGVKDATQYTLPKDVFLEKVRNGENPEFSAQKAHLREVYVVLYDGADEKYVKEQIKNMPDYFLGYETNIYFVSQEELDRNHKGMPHGGRVIREGLTYGHSRSLMEFGLDLTSNPDFTAAVDIAYARAVYKMAKENITGAKTVLDVAPAYLSSYDLDYLLKHNI